MLFRSLSGWFCRLGHVFCRLNPLLRLQFMNEWVRGCLCVQKSLRRYLRRIAYDEIVDVVIVDYVGYVVSCLLRRDRSFIIIIKICHGVAWWTLLFLRILVGATSDTSHVLVCWMVRLFLLSVLLLRFLNYFSVISNITELQRLPEIFLRLLDVYLFDLALLVLYLPFFVEKILIVLSSCWRLTLLGLSLNWLNLTLMNWVALQRIVRQLQRIRADLREIRNASHLVNVHFKRLNCSFHLSCFLVSNDGNYVVFQLQVIWGFRRDKTRSLRWLLIVVNPFYRSLTLWKLLVAIRIERTHLGVYERIP